MNLKATIRVLVSLYGFGQGLCKEYFLRKLGSIIIQMRNLDSLFQHAHEQRHRQNTGENLPF